MNKQVNPIGTRTAIVSGHDFTRADDNRWNFLAVVLL
jgi:hypothetical protein